jgi:hypothetical protein
MQRFEAWYLRWGILLGTLYAVSHLNSYMKQNQLTASAGPKCIRTISVQSNFTVPPARTAAFRSGARGFR